MARKKVELEEREVDGVVTVGKECTKCGEWKALTDYHKQKTGLGGRESKCKACRSAAQRAKLEAEKGPDVRKVSTLEEREVDGVSITGKCCTTCGEWKALESGFNSNGKGGRRPDCKACEKAYREANKERIAERDRNYREANKERITEYSRNYYEANKEYYAERGRNHREANKESIAERMRNYQADNLESYRIRKQRRRARKQALPDTYAPEDKTFTCDLTGTPDVHLDHVIPLSIGHGGTIEENMLPLRGDLNLSKSDHNIFEWFDANHERLGLSQRKFDELIAYLSDLNGLTPEEYREYVYWCHDNPRDLNDDGELYYVNGCEHWTKRDEEWAKFTDHFKDDKRTETTSA